MKILRIVLLLLLTLGASGLRGQSAREEIQANPAYADGIYRPYSYDNPVCTPAPKGYEPFYISHFGRHGSRWLLRDHEYDDLKTYFEQAKQAGGLTDYGRDICARIEIVCADGKGRAGELAPLGTVQHREIAERMYRAYPRIFAANARIEARSTVVVRCILSMAAFCERLKELEPGLRIDRTASIRNTRIFNFFAPTANPDVSKEYLELPKSASWSTANAEFCAGRIDPARVAGLLFTPEYASQLQEPRRLMQLLGNARASLHGLDVDVTLDDLFTVDELYALWECENRDFYLHRGPNPETKDYTEHLASIFVADILDRADKAIAEGAPAADLRFGHDGNMMSILNLLRFEGCATTASSEDEIADVWRNYYISPMASNIQFVFFRHAKRGDVLVKLLHNEREVRIPLTSDVAPYYHWEALRKYYRELLTHTEAWKQTK